MRTLVRIESANCTYCMNDVREALLARPLVRSVRMSATAGCLEVEHDHDDPSALTELLRQSLHAWEAADNGEIVAVRTSPEIADECVWHGGRGTA